MSRTDLLCLNRVIKPQIPLEEFLNFTADLGIKYLAARQQGKLQDVHEMSLRLITVYLGLVDSGH
jgi:predicted xylose isomerase-like sugar epimerase